MTELIAVFDEKKRLFGTKRKARPGKDDVILPDNCDLQDDVILPDNCDLPTDGSYKWDGTCFVPLGHGFGPVVAKPPFSESSVLYLLVVALGDGAPHPAREWADWYAENLKVREEELALRHSKPKIRR